MSSSAKSSSTSSACPASTTGSQLKRQTLPGGLSPRLRRLLPGGVFALVEDVFGPREGRHPAPVAQDRVPAAMIDVEMRAEHVVDVLELEAGGAKALEPGRLREVHRRGVALVLAGAGVDEDRVLGRAHDEGLVGDHHLAGGLIEHPRLELGDVPLAELRVVVREHVLRPAPRPVALDDARDRHVSDRQAAHAPPPPGPARFEFIKHDPEKWLPVFGKDHAQTKR